MSLLDPIWLLLLLPAAFLLQTLPARRPVETGLRVLTLLALILALAGLAWKQEKDGGTVVALVDQSHSMPGTATSGQLEAIRALESSMEAHHKLAVLSFGQDVALERLPGQGPFPGFQAQVAPGGSNIQAALQTALGLVPSETAGRVLLLSDGLWTGKNPESTALQATSRGVPLDFRYLSRSRAGDMAILELEGPSSVAPGENFLLKALLWAPQAMEVQYQLERDGQVLSSGSRALQTGQNRLVFREQAQLDVLHSYRLKITGTAPDPVPENNVAQKIVGLEAPRKILLVTRSKNSGLAALLQAGKLDVEVQAPGNCNWSLEALSRYSTILLENVPAQDLEGNAMEVLASWVVELGGGLLMTGGENSYASGGYFRSPLDPILPISMELRQEHRKLSLALMVALDRSGSMSAPVTMGKTKMDLANEASVQVLELLSPLDELGVLAVDSEAHVVFPLAPLTNPQSMANSILGIESMGGGIFVHEALVEAGRQLLQAKAGTRHIILFADAADAEEPGDYPELLKRFQAAGISLSVIGLGTKSDSDAALLQDLARLGGGEAYFTQDPHQLPRLFAQDTFLVARSTFQETETPLEWTGSLTQLFSQNLSVAPSLGGYNLGYPKPGGIIAAKSLDEFEAPLLAGWQAGLGRVLCWMGEADGEFAGPFAEWPEVGNFYVGLARWVSQGTQELPNGMELRQRLTDGAIRVELHLDGESFWPPPSSNPVLRTVFHAPESSPRTLRSRMQWEDATTLVAEIPLESEEVALSALEWEGQLHSLPPVRLLYSPEFRPQGQRDGEEHLKELSRLTGGERRVELSGIWQALPRRLAWHSWTPFLLLAACFFFWLQLLEHRTGILSRWFFRSSGPSESSLLEANPNISSQKKRGGAPPLNPLDTTPESPQEIEEPKPSNPHTGSFLSALQEAQKEARKRTGK